MTTWQREIAQARSVGDILVEDEAITKADLERAKALAEEKDVCVEEILREEGQVTEELLQRAIAEHYRVPTEEQFSLSIFSPEGLSRLLKPVFRMLFGERKGDFCAFKLACRAEQRRRKILQKQAQLEARIEEEKKERRDRAHAKRKAAKAASLESMLVVKEKKPGKSLLESLEEWKKHWSAWQTQRAKAGKAAQEESERRKAEKKAQADARRAEKAAAAEAQREARRIRNSERLELVKAFLNRPQVAFRTWRETQARLQEERKAQKAAIREEKRLVREQKQEEFRLKREADRAEKQVKRKAFFAKIFGKRPKSAEENTKEEMRLAEEAKREARRQVLIEQEKRKLHAELGEATKEEIAGSRAAVIMQVGGGVEKAHLLEERQKASELFDTEREIIREKARREAEEKFEAQLAALALEKEKAVQEALSRAQAEVTAKKSGANPALKQELDQWKKQVEKLEKEKEEMEQKRLLQEEQEKAHKEERSMEEEKLLRERQRLEKERENLTEEKAYRERVTEEKKELEEMRKQLQQEQKEVSLSSLAGSKTSEKAPGPAPLPPPTALPKKKARQKGEEKKTGGEIQAAPAIDIGKILLAQNYIEERELADAEEKARERNVPVDLILKDEGLVTKELLQNAIAEYYKIPFVDLRSQPPDSTVIELLPETFSIAFNAVAVQKNEDGSLLVATSSPEQETLIPEIQKLLPQIPSIALAYAPKESIESALTFYRKPLDTRFRKILEEHRKIAPEIIEEIFGDAVQLGASDIHFEPQEKIVIVRFRVDGVMHEAGRIPKEYYEGIINRIKIAGNMRIDEHFTAQDGAIRWKSGEKSMDVRVSIVPIVDGEKIVMRLLSEYVRTLTLSDLGCTSAQREVLIKAAHKPFGMLLTTGPTGSGKSTTLYGLMKIRNTPDVNISTIEDPVEYKIPGINHIQVNTKTDLTFERGLRALVRQDPDIILVGEIRDNITAQISVNAALTGHLLFSTLHANDAATAVPRLLEMGIEPYLLASTLELIIAQRLMRRICLNCRYSYNLSRKEACSLFHNAEYYFSKQEGTITLYRGKGCAACGETGYRGRLGVYELLVVTQELEDSIVQRRTTADINNVARSQGMLTLFEDGLLKVRNGLSTIEELLRIAAPPDTFLPSSLPSSHEPVLVPEEK